MMEGIFDIGGVAVRILAPAGTVALEGLKSFRLESGRWEHTLRLELAEALELPGEAPVFDSPERRVYLRGDSVITLIGTREAPYLRLCRQGNDTLAQLGPGTVQLPLGSRILLRCLETEHLVVSRQGILLHSSLIDREGEAIAFTAPSGTGKSTQAELWRGLRGARILNGDRCVLRREEDGFWALGIPFSGSSGICGQARLPLAAVVVLSQAKQTAIRQLSPREAFRALWEGCSLHTWNREDVAACSDTVARLATQGKIYHLACTPDESAVLALETMLKK